VFGVTALFLPGLTLATLVILFAVYLVVVGVIELVHGFSSINKNGSWWFMLLVGLVSAGLGVYLIRNPSTALDAFIILVGALVLARGVFDLVVAAFFTRRMESRWLWAISGALGVVAGVVLWSNPVSGGLAFVWVLGLYALVVGSISLAYAFQVRGAIDELEAGVESFVKNPVRALRGRK
jgi:uncharacterized membrane protein HdeD (DUF308 family)